MMNIESDNLINLKNLSNPIRIEKNNENKEINVIPIDDSINYAESYYKNFKGLSVSNTDISNIVFLRISSDIDLSNLNFCNCKDANGQFDENLVPKNLEYLYYDGTQSQIDPVKDGIFNTSQSKLQSRLSSLKACIMPNMNKVHHHMFKNCKSLVSVDISQVTSLGGDAFSHCYKLSYLGNNNKLNENLKEIPEYTFSGCDSLASVDISQVTSLGWGAFNACSNLYNLGINNKLNENLKEIPEYTFNGCRSLVSVDISQVTSLGWAPFSGCSKLSNLGYVDGVLNKLNENLKEIPEYIFSGCDSLASVDISQVTSLGWGAFNGCSKLKKIKLPKLNKTFVSNSNIDIRLFAPFGKTTDLSLYYRDPKDSNYSNPDNNDYPKQLSPDTFEGMSGNWAFIMSPAGYKQLVDDIINDKDDLKVAAYKDYLNLGWKSNMGWGNKTPTDKGLANADGKFVQQHIISLADISNESDINSFVRNKNDDIEIEFNTSSKKTIGILKLEKDKNSNKDIAAVITK